MYFININNLIAGHRYQYNFNFTTICSSGEIMLFWHWCICQLLDEFTEHNVGYTTLWSYRKGLCMCDTFYSGIQLINIRPRKKIQLTNQGEEEHFVARTFGQGLLLFTAHIPYRVSCPDQQGQTNPLITQTADENESKMRPITTQAWLISLYRPLHTHWTHAHSHHTCTCKFHVYTKSQTRTSRCSSINNVTQEQRWGEVGNKP